MSRREPRLSAVVRPNDALYEYEALKKKFLHANKAITKLNSTLSVRIEELNAELSTLYVENLRLRTSELALAAQLKRERERSRKLLAETEAATLNLAKQFEYLRRSYNIDTSPPTPPTPPSPKARRPPPIANVDAQIGRLSRPPNVPEIREEEEPVLSSSDSDQHKPNPFQARVSTKSHSPASWGPRRIRPSSPPLLNELSTSTHRKKPARRQSGMLTVNKEAITLQRPPSPTSGSLVQKAAAPMQEDENEEVDIANLLKARRSAKTEHRKREAKLPNKESLEDNGATVNVADIKRREKKRRRDEDEITQKEEPSKPASRFALQPIDNMVQDPGEMDKKVTQTFSIPLTTHATPPMAIPSSNTPLEVDNVDLQTAASNGRERRARKSVNYTEPKLNTKMRKPDPPPGSEVTSRKKRSSAAAVMTTAAFKPHDVEMKFTSPGSDSETRTLVEPPRVALNLAIYTPSQTSSSSLAIISSMKKKARPRPLSDEDSSDGAEADEEYIPPGPSNWINMGGRKRINSARRTISTSPDPAIEIGTDSRRHSMAV